MDEIFQKYPTLIKEIQRTMEKLDYNGMKPWNEERLRNEPPALLKALMRDYTLNVHE